MRGSAALRVWLACALPVALGACPAALDDDTTAGPGGSGAASTATGEDDRGGTGTGSPEDSGAVSATSTSTADNSDDGTPDTGDSSTTSGESSGTSSSSGAPICPDWGDPNNTCTLPSQCTGGTDCGDPVSFFEEDGCPRPHCDSEDDECPPGWRCFFPYACDLPCLDGRVGCSEVPDGDGGSYCACSGDGSCGGRVCLREELLGPDGCPV